MRSCTDLPVFAARLGAASPANVLLAQRQRPPTYLIDDVVHYCVTNMPGAVGRTSTYALTNVTLPYVLQLASKGLDRAVADNPALCQGVNIRGGQVTNPAVAATFGLECATI